jgi:hypothetical protein
LVDGHRAVVGHHEAAVAERRQPLARTSVVLTGTYGKEYLRRLLEGWPE